MSNINFGIVKKDRKTKARLGVLKTPHGKIETPSYVIVATHAAVRSLKSSDIKKTKTQVVISNTYHLWDPALARKNGASKASKKLDTFLIQRLGLRIPTMTDSGGFQVFSLGFGNKFRVGKILRKNTRPVRSRSPLATSSSNGVKITKDGVYFMLGGKKKFLGPELSIKLQEKLGADIIFAFDECTSPLDSYAYNKKALERTHRWARKCLSVRKRKDQLLFGIVQGGRFKDLRIRSAKFIGSLPFEGVGIGGSFGKEEMVKTLKWIVPNLPEEKPRHLLGIGRVEDVFNAVENGIDLFDCVIPTREARHGRLWTDRGPTKDKAKDPRLATIHNILFFNNLLEEIRKSIKRGRFLEFKRSYLKRFSS